MDISKCEICCGQRTNRFREDNGEVIEVIEHPNGNRAGDARHR